MHNVSILLGQELFPVETVRLEPLERGRVALYIKSPVSLRKGESCRMRTSTGAEIECVVSEIYSQPDGALTELRCIPEPSSPAANG